MSADIRVPLPLCLQKSVITALRHYTRVRAITPTGEVPNRFSISWAANEILASGLSRRGFNPKTLKLIGGRP